jgi:hypothetical protein
LRLNAEIRSAYPGRPGIRVYAGDCVAADTSGSSYETSASSSALPRPQATTARSAARIARTPAAPRDPAARDGEPDRALASHDRRPGGVGVRQDPLTRRLQAAAPPQALARRRELAASVEELSWDE